MIVDIVAMADIIAISFLAILLILCFGFFILYRLRYDRVLSTLTQLLIDKAAMSEEIDRLQFLQENSNDIENGFIKFLSESREQAFAYIEQVQVSISDLQDAMGSGSDENIAIAYQKLINLLPDNSTDMVD